MVVSSTKIQARDLANSFFFHPITGAPATVTNVDVVRQSVKNLILTGHYEVPFHPEVGTNVKKILFDLNTPGLYPGIEEDIRNAISQYEPRADVARVEVDGDIDSRNVEIKVYFYVLGVRELQDVDIFIRRVR
jgi:phage baseplate assembly protein W